jgi:hypothetical protein
LLAEKKVAKQKIESQWIRDNFLSKDNQRAIDHFKKGTYGETERAKCLLARIVNGWTALHVPIMHNKSSEH